MKCTQDTAVVILSYNGRKWHELFLPTIVAEAGAGYDVIVADNASTDDTAAWVSANFPTVKLLHIPVNKGFTGGYVAALEQIDAKYYVLLSSDFEVTPGWFSPLHNAMETQPNLAACQPKIRYWKEREKFEYAGAAGGFIDKWGYLFCRGRIFDTLEEDRGQYNTDSEIFWAGGGCLFVRADVYHAVGGLDVDLYAHMEEVDLCWRIKNAGYRIACIANSTVFHVGGSVISYGSPQKTFYNYRNNLVLLLKNERGSRLLWLIPWRLVLDGLSAVRMMSQGKWQLVATILRAHFSFYRHFGTWWKHRKSAQKSLRQPNNAGRYSKSIVWDYFGKGKKKFSDLGWDAPQL
ncbi:MAG: glycosyltransferase family 2 protein [Bacteroidetes bacterium]|nr:glycosyltransferase family 2 protein [Bacteroidota bacterium]